MKKIYESPAVQVVNVELQPLMEPSATMDSAKTIESSSEFGSRDFDDWDE